MSSTQPLVKRLGDILTKENISNSYYNDEYYTPCKTADYDKAYNEILNEEELTKESLKTTYRFRDKENGESVDFNLRDVLKMVIAGDFGSQYKTTSSLEKNLKAIAKLHELTSKGLNPKEHEDFWSGKEDIDPQTIRELRGREYQKAYLVKRSVCDMVAQRFDFYGFKSKEELQAAHIVAKKLKSNKDFVKEASPSYMKDACQRLIDSAETGEEKQATLKNIRDAANNVRNKSYAAIADLSHYDIRRVAITALLFGKSNDSHFDKVINSLENFENVISQRGKTLDINI
jgi:hypothetical protein